MVFGDSSGDDDYMSDALLSNIADVRPGINAESRAQRRFLQIEANRRAADERAEAARKPKKAELERNLLEEGLSRPIDSGSKGFSLLAKMGYKPGMSLGRKREGDSEGIKEPIAISMKVTKVGLGHEAEEQERQRERCEKHLAHMRQRARNEEIIADDFRERKRFAVLQKRLIADLQNARKACQELDLRKNLEAPREYWFWPIHRLREETSEAGPSVIRRDPSAKESECTFVYANGRTTMEEELNLFEYDEEKLQELLSRINVHIRETHDYCIWCGCAYSSRQDLDENCPGSTRGDHDGDDDDGD